MSGPAGARTRFTILTLLGAWAEEIGDRLWLSGLLELLGTLGLHDAAARAQLQRMAADGWFDVSRHGRRSCYRITPRTAAELRGGDLRVLEPTAAAWDGSWTMVHYEMPEPQRAARDRFRLQLQWLGFGALGAGAWLSPHDRVDAVLEAIRRCEVPDGVHIWRPAVLRSSAPTDVVTRCWDLDALDARYRALDAAVRAAPRRPVDDADAFRTDFVLLTGLLDVLRVDPNLPAELLPARWRGAEVRRRLASRRLVLRPAATRYLATVLQAASPPTRPGV